MADTSNANTKILEARLAAAKARYDAAAPSEEEKAARDLRRKIAQLEADAESAERERLVDDLDARVDAARIADPKGRFLGIMSKTFADTFIIQRNGQAHASWTAATSAFLVDKAQGKRTAADSVQIDRDYVLGCVYDWNGRTEFDTDPELSGKLRAYLIENPGLITPIKNAAGELAGAFVEERASKS